jgi:hypothetical protein
MMNAKAESTVQCPVSPTGLDARFIDIFTKELIEK